MKPLPKNFLIKILVASVIISASHTSIAQRRQKEQNQFVTGEAKFKPILIGNPPAEDEKSFNEIKGKFKEALKIVIDSPYQIWSKMGTYIHIVVYGPDFSPVKNGKVYLDGKPIGRTDKNGTFVFSISPNPDKSYSNNHVVDVLYEKKGKLLHGKVMFKAYPRTESFRTVRIFAYTDRGIYNPGQTIHVRAIAWELKGDFKPIHESEIEFLLKTSDGKVVGGGAVETNRWGIGVLDIPLPENAPEGLYFLEASYQRQVASTKLRVERLTPPVIEIKHTLPRFLLRDQDELNFEVKLAYYTGSQFQSGEVRIKLIYNARVFYEEKKSVRGSGPHTFKIGASAVAKLRKTVPENGYLQVAIEVEDEFHRKAELKRDMRYVANPYIAVVETDKDQYTTGQTAHLMIRVSDVEHVPLRGRKITLKWENGSAEGQTDSNGIAKIDIPVGKSHIKGKVFIEGVKKPVTDFYVKWVKPRPMSSEIPQGYLKENHSASIIVRFPTKFIPKEKFVHMDIVDSSGAIIGAQLIPIKKKKNGKYEAKGSFIAPSWGSMLLTLFCVGTKGKQPVGLLTDGQNLVVVPDREIKIEMDGVPEVAKPGSEITFTGRIFNSKAELINASVGASIVDAAVIGLVDPLEKTPMDEFYNPQLKVLSQTGSKILTWPVVTRNWGYPRYDIALPPFGFKQGSRHPEQMPEETIKVKTGDGAAKPITAGAKVKMAPEALPLECKTCPAVTPKPLGYGHTEKEEKPESAGRGYSRSTPLGQESSTIITLRKNFFETSAWLPTLEAHEGLVEISSKLPDAITIQTVTLIASDDAGGVGMKRRKIKVTQPLFIRSEFPATLTAGDRVESFASITNLTNKELNCTVNFSSDIIKVYNTKPVKVKVPAGGIAPVGFLVEPQKAGWTDYTITADCGQWIDSEKRQIFIRPLGIPDRIEAKGKLSREKPFIVDINVSGKDLYLKGFIHVSFPTVVPALQAMEEIISKPGGAVDFISTKALITGAALRYLIERNPAAEQLNKVKHAASKLMSAVLFAQRSDGGWGFYFNFFRSMPSGAASIPAIKSNPYMTALSLEALTELKKSGMSVPLNSIRRAMHFLADSLGTETLWSVKSISFYEGESEKVKLGISSEIFRAMADAYRSFPELKYDYKIPKTMKSLYIKFKEIVKDVYQTDPLILANSSLGLLWSAEAEGVDTRRLKSQLNEVAKRLIVARREAYWEPSWFHAYGGSLVATEAVIRFMMNLGKTTYDSDIREAVKYIISTQNSFGSWHNERGTAAAIRALLAIPPATEEIPSKVRVIINGEEVEVVEINPQDPFLSSVKLRQLDITKYLLKGKNRVEIRYSGNLTARVSIFIEKWSKKKQFQPLKYENSPPVFVNRKYQKVSDKKGSPVKVTLTISSKKKNIPPLRIIEPLPSNAQVDSTSVENLLTNGIINGYELRSDKVIFHIMKLNKQIQKLEYLLFPERRGVALQPGTIITTPAQQYAPTSGGPTKFHVE